MNALHEVRQVFDDRNPFLQVALGLVSTSLRYERLLREEVSFAPAPSSGIDDPALDFFLGLVAFTERVLVHAEAATRERRIEGEPPASSGSPLLPGSGLLR